MEQPVLIVLFSLFLLTFLVQLYYYIFLFRRSILYKNEKAPIPKLPVSVIICAKDEASNLKKFLPSILSQDYPDFEVIVVNDCSEDNTEAILNDFSELFPNLRYTTIKKDLKFTHGKKLAQTIGIKAAKNEILIFTDADCYAVSNKWIERIQQNFNTGTEIVLGYGGYLKNDSILNKLIRYDTLFIALQYFSYALSGFPYMGVGRNLAYRKSTFFNNKGFASHSKLDSGDDDLFVNEVANKSNTSIEFSNESQTRSIPKTNFKKWVRQKLRHNSTFKYYRKKHKNLLFIEILSRMLFYFLTIFLLIFSINLWYWILGVFLIRYFVQINVIKKTSLVFKENDLLLFSFIFDMFLPFFNFGLIITNLFITKNNKWK